MPLTGDAASLLHRRAVQLHLVHFPRSSLPKIHSARSFPFLAVSHCYMGVLVHDNHERIMTKY